MDEPTGGSGPTDRASDRREAPRSPGTLRWLNAGNSGPFTLDGTRTWLVGDTRVAVIDPGPDSEAHVGALVAALGGATEVRIVLTHGHADHAGAAPALKAELGADVYGPEGVPGVDRVLGDGDRVATDRGELVAVHTPGHTPEHLCYEWPARRALFAGDLVLGEGDTTWVAEYPGCVADYLASIERVRALDLVVLYPAHGPPLEEPAAALDRYEAHRRARIEQVRVALAGAPDATDAELLRSVYGDDIPPGMTPAALRSLSALREYVEARS